VLCTGTHIFLLKDKQIGRSSLQCSRGTKSMEAPLAVELVNYSCTGRGKSGKMAKYFISYDKPVAGKYAFVLINISKVM
jgi:hypothetical protein